MQILRRPAHFVYPLLINVSQIAPSDHVNLLLIVLQIISKNKIIGRVTKYKYMPDRHKGRAPVDLNGY